MPNYYSTDKRWILKLKIEMPQTHLWSYFIRNGNRQLKNKRMISHPPRFKIVNLVKIGNFRRSRTRFIKSFFKSSIRCKKEKKILPFLYKNQKMLALAVNSVVPHRVN